MLQYRPKVLVTFWAKRQLRQKKFARRLQLARRNLLECAWTSRPQHYGGATFHNYGRTNHTGLPCLIDRRNTSLTDRNGKRSIHNALQLAAKPPDTTSPQVNIVRALSDHRSLAFDDANKTIRNESCIDRSRIRLRRTDVRLIVVDSW